MKVRLQLIGIFIAACMAAGCGAPGTPLPPSLELPRTASDLAAVRKGNTVTLTWTMPAQTTDGQNLRANKLGPAHVCRAVARYPMPYCIQLAGEIPAEKIALTKPGEKPNKVTFTDTLSPEVEQQHANEFATYAVSLLNWRARTAGLSNQVRVPLAPVVAPPAEVKAEVTADGIRLVFGTTATSGNASGTSRQYRIFRRAEGASGAIAIGETNAELSSQKPAETPAQAQLSFTVTDRSFEWEKTYYYHVTPVTAIMENGKNVAEVRGDDSPEVKVVTRDVFPAGQPTGLQAVFSGVGQKPFVDLTWAPNMEADLAGYNVYRHQLGQPEVKINRELVKTPSFRDENVQAGQTYSYSVSAVDLRGNESGKSEETSERIP
jgi:hypothetical protein